MKSSPNLLDHARNDMELLMAARSGDTKAFDQLMKRYKDALHFMILKMVKNKTDAEDLTIEAFEKAFVNIKKCEPPYAFSTWLFSVASNYTIDHLRKKMIIYVPYNCNEEYDKTNETEYYNNLLVTDENPEEIYIKKQNITLLTIALSGLKPKYQTLLKLRYFKDYSYSEIAKELNIPLATIRVQLYRSRKMLYNLLKNTSINH